MTNFRFIGFVVAIIWLQSCNYNDFTPEVERAVRESIDLQVITSSEIIVPFSSNNRQTIRFTTSENSENQGDLYFYASHDLLASSNAIQNIIVNIHGLAASDTEVRNEFNSMVTAVGASGAAATTLVIAPHFLSDGTGLEMDWENAVWRGGGKASTPSGAQLSASQIVDYILETMILEVDNFPNLNVVIIAGHSAGGQFVQRYAAISKLENQHPEVDFSYLPANPSHYLYLNAKRWNGSAIFTPAVCPTYNDYPYGLDGLTLDERYAFVSKIGIETIRGNFIFRDVRYVLGSSDVTGATTDCESLQQQGGSGDNRFLRGQYLKQFMDNQYPSNEHQLVTVVGEGHSANGIYTSPEYVQLLNGLLQ